MGRWHHKKTKTGGPDILTECRGISPTESGTYKMELLGHFTTANQIDMCSITETNTNWSEVPTNQHPHNATWFWWECIKWNTMYNQTKEHKQEYQPGGATVLVINKMAHRATATGENKTGQGQWCWTKLRGKQNTHIQIYAAYWSCKTFGPLTSYQQQQWYFFRTQNALKYPWDSFWKDISKEIRDTQSDGDLILVLANINKDVQGTMTQEHLRKLGLVEAVTKLHMSKPPPTHQWGQVPIDGIFITPILMDQIRGGYMAFNEGMGSDHRGIWIDIPGQHLFGTMEHNFTLAKAWCEMPRPEGGSKIQQASQSQDKSGTATQKNWQTPRENIQWTHS